MMMIKCLIYLLVLTITSMLLIGTAMGGLYFVYGFMTCTIFLISVIVFLFGIVWMLEYGCDYNDDDDKQNNK
jgi:hypothetical protein